MKNRQRYPRNWRKLAKACKERAGWRCQECGVKHGFVRRSLWTGRLWPVYLQAAHKQHDPENETPELIAVCPACHWHFYRRPGQKPPWMIEKMKHRKLIKRAWCM